MDIENITITKQASYRSDQAYYQLEYSINNGLLSWIRATVNEPEADQWANNIYVGSIHYENNMINCSLPAQLDVSAYFQDFESIVAFIREDVRLQAEK